MSMYLNLPWVPPALPSRTSSSVPLIFPFPLPFKSPGRWVDPPVSHKRGMILLWEYSISSIKGLYITL